MNKYINKQKKHWIKNWPENERPRELLIKNGPEHVSDAGLIAILLRTGTRGKDAVTLARELIDRFGSLRELLSARKEDLKNIKGLGNAKISQILAAFEILKRLLKEELISKTYVKNDQDVIDYLALSMRDLKKEFFKVIYLNKSNMILSIDDMVSGTVDNSLIHPRELIKRALDIDSSSVIFIHNHPSGSLEPSQPDIEVTQRLVSACKAVGITPLDHIIVSPYGHVSLKNKRFLI